MKEIYKNALSEVNAIINNSDENIINKIPNKFMNFVQNNMNKSYTIEMDLDKEILEQNISNEAKSIIALIYRDYICPKAERQTLIKREILERQKQEELKKEKYELKWNKRNL